MRWSKIRVCLRRWQELETKIVEVFWAQTVTIRKEKRRKGETGSERRMVDPTTTKGLGSPCEYEALRRSWKKAAQIEVCKKSVLPLLKRKSP